MGMSSESWNPRIVRPFFEYRRLLWWNKWNAASPQIDKYTVLPSPPINQNCARSQTVFLRIEFARDSEQKPQLSNYASVTTYSYQRTGRKKSFTRGLIDRELHGLTCSWISTSPQSFRIPSSIDTGCVCVSWKRAISCIKLVCDFRLNAFSLKESDSKVDD